MKYIALSTALALLCLNPIFAQERAQPITKLDAFSADRSVSGIKTIGGISAEELIRKVFIGGDCFDVSNVKYTGDPVSIAKFSEGKNGIGIENGIVLTTGNAQSVEGPNNSATFGYTSNSNLQDKDLKKLLNSNESINDQCIIEFDFVPTANSIKFDFVFASEEYCEYVNSAYNDIFGFFISGPGISGSYSGNGKNIALIPNTNQNVSINNVNNLNYSNYYINNVNTLFNSAGSCSSISSLGKYLSETQFDGFTTVLTASTAVTPCEKYHIKLAIADIKDHGYDSAVFLRANSFNNGDNAIVAPSTPKTLAIDTETVYEGCDSTAFTFSRLNDDLSKPLVINYTLDPSSTAIEGLDYQAFPLSVTIPIGQKTVRVPINILTDAIAEPDEKIVIAVDKSCSCSKSTISIKIKDAPPFLVTVKDTAFCGNASLTLNSKISGNIGTVKYLWSNGETSPSIKINTSSSVTYNLTVTDGCSKKAIDDAKVILAPNPTAKLQTTEVSVCRIGQPITLPVTLTGLSPYQLTYKINGKTKTQQNILVDSIQLKADTIGTLQLIAVKGLGCDGTVSGAAKISLKPIELSVLPLQVKCAGEKTGAVNLTVGGGGTAPFAYDWSNGNKNKDLKNVGKGKYSIKVKDVNDCEAKLDIELSEPQVLTAKVIKTKATTCANPYGGYIDAEGFGGTPPYSFTWKNQSGNFKKDSLKAGDYQALVKDGNGCETTLIANVKADTIAAKSLDYEAISPSCRNPLGSLFIKGATGGVPPYTYAFDTNPNFSNEKIYDKLSPNQYFVSVKGLNGCIFKTAVKIPEYRLPEVILNPKDTVIFPGDSIQLEAFHNLSDANLKSITWTPPIGLDCTDCLDPLAKPLIGTTYIITVKDKFDCYAKAESKIRIDKNVKVYIPNMFRPDGFDGNKRLTVFGNPKQIKKVSVLRVFDRWGDKIFENQDITLNDERGGWDGTYNNNGGELMTSQTYVYYSEVLLQNGETIKLSGDVVLLK